MNYIDCTTCGGIPPVSGLVCICGGHNTIYAEVQGLREALFDAAQYTLTVRAEEREACIEALRTLWDAGDWLNHNCMECGITFKMVAAVIRERTLQ